MIRTIAALLFVFAFSANTNLCQAQVGGGGGGNFDPMQAVFEDWLDHNQLIVYLNGHFNDMGTAKDAILDELDNASPIASIIQAHWVTGFPPADQTKVFVTDHVNYGTRVTNFRQNTWDFHQNAAAALAADENNHADIESYAIDWEVELTALLNQANVVEDWLEAIEDANTGNIGYGFSPIGTQLDNIDVTIQRIELLIVQHEFFMFINDLDQ